MQNSLLKHDFPCIQPRSFIVDQWFVNHSLQRLVHMRDRSYPQRIFCPSWSANTQYYYYVCTQPFAVSDIMFDDIMCIPWMVCYLPDPFYLLEKEGLACETSLLHIRRPTYTCMQKISIFLYCLDFLWPSFTNERKHLHPLFSKHCHKCLLILVFWVFSHGKSGGKGYCEQPTITCTCMKQYQWHVKTNKHRRRKMSGVGGGTS